jgi:hypothetical protein
MGDADADIVCDMRRQPEFEPLGNDRERKVWAERIAIEQTLDQCLCSGRR